MLQRPDTQKRLPLILVGPVFSVLAATDCFLIFAPSLGQAVSYWPETCLVGILLLGAIAWYLFPEDRSHA